jgi:hypothetical protein
MAHKIAVTVSYGDTENEDFTRSIHMLNYDEVELTEAEAKTLQAVLVNMICNIKQKSSDKTVMGIYKDEYPTIDRSNPQ